MAGAVKGIAAINQSGIPGGGGGAAASSSSAGVSIPAPTVGSVSAPQIQGTQNGTTGTQIAATLSESTNKPVRAFVVERDISSQQALARRTSRAATFG